MGLVYIITICDDAIRDGIGVKESKQDCIQEVGKAVMEVIRTKRYSRIRHPNARVFHKGGCVMFVDEVHSTVEKVLLWFGNCLRPIHELDEEDFKIVEELVTVERNRR